MAFTVGGFTRRDGTYVGPFVANPAPKQSLQTLGHPKMINQAIAVAEGRVKRNPRTGQLMKGTKKRR